MTETTVGTLSDRETADVVDWQTPDPMFPDEVRSWESTGTEREAPIWQDVWSDLSSTGSALRGASREAQVDLLEREPATGEPRLADMADDTPALDVRAQRANQLRLELLSRRYARKQLTPEEQARLEIVSSTVRALLPTVTAEDFQFLNDLDERRKERDEEVAAMMRDLGLE